MVYVSLNGKILEESKAHLSIHDAGFLFGEGIYETLRTRLGKVFDVEAHLMRLERSARFLALPLPARPVLSRWISAVVERNDFWRRGLDARIRVTISGGVHPRDEDPRAPTILITVFPLNSVERERKRGVPVITYRMERFLPLIKTTHLLPGILARRAMRKARAYEVLLVNREGHVTEGSISNFFIVRKGRLFTPCSEALPGTTQKMIFHLARRLKIKVVRCPIRVPTLLKADEFFICNAPRGIIPVVRVNGHRVHDGKVGPITRQFMKFL